MFVLAHLSDPHLAPLPTPNPLELFSKRGLGFINWLRKRRAIHRPEVLAALVADLKGRAPDHIAVTGDLVNLSLTQRVSPARAPGSNGWAIRATSPWCPAITMPMCARRPGSRSATGAITCAATTARAFRSCAGADRWR